MINNPRQCHFNPDELLCTGEDNDSCLTAPQLTALKKIYYGPHNSTGQTINPGFLPGAEAYAGGWSTWITGPGSNADSLTRAHNINLALTSLGTSCSTIPTGT